MMKFRLVLFMLIVIIGSHIFVIEKVEAEGDCCVYVDYSYTSGFGDGDTDTNKTYCVADDPKFPDDPPHEVYIGDTDEPETTNAATSFSCPLGAYPEKIAGALYVYDLHLNGDDCGDPSDLAGIIVPKSNLYCQKGLKKLPDAPQKTKDAIGKVVQQLYDAVLITQSSKMCCVPVDPKKTPSLKCAIPAIKPTVKDIISNHFFYKPPGPKPETAFASNIYCGQNETNYELMERPCTEDIALDPTEMPLAYQGASYGLKATMKGMCGSVLDAAAGPKPTTMSSSSPTIKKDKTPSGPLINIDLSSLNPLGTTSPETLIARGISILMGVLGSIALVMFIYGGVLWMTAAGKPDQVKKGFSVLVWGALGVMVIFASYAIVTFVFSAFL